MNGRGSSWGTPTPGAAVTEEQRRPPLLTRRGRVSEEPTELGETAAPWWWPTSLLRGWVKMREGHKRVGIKWLLLMKQHSGSSLP